MIVLKENLASTEVSCQCHPNVITYQQFLAGKTKKSSMIKCLEDVDIKFEI